MNPREAFYNLAVARIGARIEAGFQGRFEVCDLPCGDGQGSRLIAAHAGVVHCIGIDNWEATPDGEKESKKLLFLPKDLRDSRRLLHRKFSLITACGLPGSGEQRRLLLTNLCELLVSGSELLMLLRKDDSDLRAIANQLAASRTPVEKTGEAQGDFIVLLCRKTEDV